MATRPFTEVVDEFLALFEPRHTLPAPQTRARIQELIAQMQTAQSQGVWVAPSDTPELPPLDGTAWRAFWEAGRRAGLEEAQAEVDKWKGLTKIAADEAFEWYDNHCGGDRENMDDLAEVDAALKAAGLLP